MATSLPKAKAAPAISLSLTSALLALVGLVGHDRTKASVHRSCLLLGPHPDDETLGCAVTIMRKRDAGTAVHIAVATDGSRFSGSPDNGWVAAMRRLEALQACSTLGLDRQDVTFLAFEDGTLNTAGEDLVEAIADLVRAFRPDEVFTTSVFDSHSDHRALGVATIRALAGRGCRILAYPIWQVEHPRALLATARAGTGRPELVSTRGYLQRKRQALLAYRSQLTPASGGDEPSGLSVPFVDRFFGRYELFFPLTESVRSQPVWGGGARDAGPLVRHGSA